MIFVYLLWFVFSTFPFLDLTKFVTKAAHYEWHLVVFPRFKCIDLDGNGILTRNELQFFYEEQLHRMECMAQEPVLFEDILCQIIDMIGPEV